MTANGNEIERNERLQNEESQMNGMQSGRRRETMMMKTLYGKTLLLASDGFSMVSSFLLVPLVLRGFLASL